MNYYKYYRVKITHQHEIYINITNYEVLTRNSYYIIDTNDFVNL